MKNINLSRIFIKYLSLQEQGFTLIELLTVIVIIGILSAISTPTLIAQVGKARETEAKNNLGVIARAQQAYHYENRAFYNGNSLDNFIEVNLSEQYYAYTADNTANQSKAIHTAYSINPGQNNARDYATGIYFDSSNYSQSFCVATGVDNDGTTSSVTAQVDGSCLGGTSLK